MKNFKFLSILLIIGYLLLATASMAADTTPPSVVSVYPTNNAGSVSLRPLISVIFNEDINPGTVNKNTFQLFNENSDPLKIVPTTQINGEVSYSLSQKMAVFKLSGDLVNNIKYTAKITSGIKDFAGNPLAQEYVWTFTTVSGTPTPCVPGSDYNPCPGTGGPPTITGGGLPTSNQNQNPPTIINNAESPESQIPSETQQPSTFSANISSKGFLGAIVPCGTQKNPDGSIANPCTVCHLFVGINNLISFLLKNIAFPLGVVAILWGGFMIMTSGGSEEKVKKGKTALEYAIYGIILAFAGWLIVGTILSSLVTKKVVWPFSREWNTIPSCPVK
jgi:hypothetical protein